MVLNSCSSGEEGTRDLFSGTAAALVQSGVSAPTRTTAAPQQDWRSPRATVVPAEPSPVDSHGREGGSASPRGRWVTRTRLAIAVGVSVVVALTAVAMTWWMNRPVTRLEVVDLAIVQGDTQAVTPDNNEWELVPPKVQITLRNIGDHVSVITGARLEVADFTHLPICWGAGGALEASQTYDVVLPENPKLNDVIEVGIAQEVEPDRAAKFELALQIRDADPALGTYCIG